MNVKTIRAGVVSRKQSIQRGGTGVPAREIARRKGRAPSNS